MSKIYGIDLGTNYSVIATLDDNGMPVVIENLRDSIPSLASVIYFPRNGDPVIGCEAKKQVDFEPDRVVPFVKRQIGYENAQIWNFEGVTYNPTTISTLILKRMKDYAGELGYDVKDVVIACPAYFRMHQLIALRQAGEVAGFNVLNTVNEPTAAVLYYCCRELCENRKIIVYDLGGEIFDLTLLEVSVTNNNKASVKIISAGGDKYLGGIDWDNRLFDYICDLYSDECGISKEQMSTEIRHKIHSHVEDVKKAFSNPSMNIKSFKISYAGDSIRLILSREKFEELTQDLVGRTMDCVHEFLLNVKYTPEDVDVVLVVGGASLMPMIKDAVEQVFPSKVRIEDPHLVVARGAALAALIEVN